VAKKRAKKGAARTSPSKSSDRRVPVVALTRLESDVMRAVWEIGAPVRVRDVLEALNGRAPSAKGRATSGRRTALAYNTVQTVLTILRHKGVVEIVPGEGRGHTYRARVSRRDASRHMLRDLVDRLFDGRVQPLLQQLVGDPSLGAEQLAELRAWVDARLRDAEDAP
jgi:predicted transcriptional regulator